MRFGINNPAFLQAAGSRKQKELQFYVEACENELNISFTDSTIFGIYAPYLEYSKNNVDWEPLTLESTILLQPYEKVYFRSLSGSDPYNKTSKVIFNASDRFNVSGDLMKLLNIKVLTSGYILCNAFKELPIVSAKNLVLNADVMSQSAYAYMFSGCTSLVDAPKLPATVLADQCYDGMFTDCTSLAEAPELPATILGDKCYIDMFKNCTSLAEAPELPATSLHDECYSGMFSGCANLVKAPKLPAISLSDKCYMNMFSGCTSLVEAPELPSTAIAQSNCYQAMFKDCASLVKAPELPATVLSAYCYSEMFSGCTSLTESPILKTETLLPGCYQLMFKGCVNLSKITCLATTIPSGSTNNWVDGVSGSGIFEKAADAEWTTGTSGIPEGWTVQDYAGQ